MGANHFTNDRISRNRSFPALGTIARNVPRARVRLLIVGEEPRSSIFSVLSKGERVLNIYPEIAHGILDLAMTEKNLDSAQVASCPVDDRCLRPAKRMGAIFTSDKPNPRHPFVDKSGVLASAEVAITIHTTWEDLIVYRAAPTFKPC